ESCVPVPTEGREQPRKETGEIMKRKTLRHVALAALFALIVAACGTEEGSSAGSDSGADATENEKAPSEATEVSDDHDDSLAITEETGSADESIEPIRIGMINMSEGTPSYPDVAEGVDAGAAYANAELEGIGGHPIE